MANPRRRPTPVKVRAASTLMVRLDGESKTYLTEAAKLRGLSLSDYVRTVTVPQVRREVLADREQTLAMTPEEQIAFWSSLAGPPTLTEPQKRLGADEGRGVSGVQFPEEAGPTTYFRPALVTRMRKIVPRSPGMTFPRVRFSMRVLLLLPVVATLLLVAIDPLTARPAYWTLATCELDVVDASNGQPIRALATLNYEGPLVGQPGSGSSYTTLGEPYVTYRGMTPNIGYGGWAAIVRHQPKTLIFRRHDLTIVEGIRFRVEADGFEPFEFAPVDSKGRPLAFETWSPPVFRVELRPKGMAGVAPSWSTRPELKHYPWKDQALRGGDE